MIAILYPQLDFEAADIALKVQSLAKSREPIYVVPKHYGRVESSILTTLSRASMGLFIANELNPIDEQTDHELQQLLSKGKRVIFIVPNDYQLPYKVSADNLVKYHKNNKTGIITDLSKWLDRISASQTAAQKDKDDTTVAVFLIASLMLLLIGVAATSTKK